MPVKNCQEGDRPGYRCGDRGKCYTYAPGNERSRKEAKRKAIVQCVIIDEPVSDADLMDADVERLYNKLFKKLKKHIKTQDDEQGS